MRKRIFRNRFATASAVHRFGWKIAIRMSEQGPTDEIFRAVFGQSIVAIIA